MKIGDEVYVHGYVDEIRKDVVIIRNEGGYFGTVADEIIGFEIKALHKDYVEPKVIIEQTEPNCDNCDKKWRSWEFPECKGCEYTEQTEPQTEREGE